MIKIRAAGRLDQQFRGFTDPRLAPVRHLHVIVPGIRWRGVVNRENRGARPNDAPVILQVHPVATPLI